MAKALLPPNEKERLEALRRYAILDTPPEAAFERLTNLAAQLFNVPIALISLVDEDRQWFKSYYGLNTQQTSRDISFCVHAILSTQVMVVPDATEDPRFADNSLVTGLPGIRFYAGAPLQTPDGFNLGTFCLMDTTPRELSQAELALLIDLATLTIDELELRLACLERQEAQQALADRARELAAAYHQAAAYARDLNTKLVERKQTQGVLRQQARVFENIYDSVILTDPAGLIIDCNPATEKLFGYARAELLGQPPRIWYRSEETTELTAKIIDGLKQNGRWSGEVNFIRKDGLEGICEVVVVPIYDERGQHIGTIGVSHDITKHRWEEKELEQRAAQLALINDIGSQIAAILQLDDILHGAAHLVQQTFGYHHVALFLLDQDVARLKAIAGSYRSYFLPNHCQRLDQGIIGWVATHGEKVVANDISAEPRYISLIAAHTVTRAELCLPIKAGGQTVGVLDIQSPQLNTFGENDVMAMETLTDQIAVAIENAHLYQALRQTTSALQAIFQAIPDLFLRLDAKGTILDCQAGPAFDDLQLSDEVFVKGSLHEIFPPNIAQQIEQAITQALETSSLVTAEYSISLPQEEQSFEARLVPLFNQQVIAIVRNITERKQVEQALRESEKKYRSVIDHVQEVIFQMDTTGLWTFLNPAWAKITGFSVEESLETNFLNYIHPDDRQWALELHQSLLKRDLEHYRHETRFQAKAGGFRWIEAYAQLILADDGTILGMSGTLNDITDRKLAEQALVASETRFRTLTTHAPVGIFQTDAGGDYIFINKRGCEITGLSPVEAMGNGWANALHPDDREQVFAEWRVARGAGQRFAMEYRFQTPEGKVTWVFGNATPLRSETREIVGYLGTVTDITERKQTELLERDRNQVLEMVSQNKPLKLVLTALIQLVERQYPGLLSSVLLLQDGRVYHEAAPNLPESFTRLIDGLTFGDILGADDTVVYRGETLIIPNIAAELEKSTYHKLALRYDLRAYWSVPIFSSDGALLGIFTNYYRQPSRPTPEELQLVGMASQLAAIAIEHHQLTEQLAYQAQHDALTGLPNRPLFEDRLHQAVARARRSGCLVGLLYVDLDRFKLVNDTLGHAAGDTLLRQVAQRLLSCVREGDTVARIGGDEFTVVLNDLENPQDAVGVTQRILETLKQPLVLRGHELFVTTSIGISLFPTDGDEAEELLRKADNALYRGKQQGKNTYQFYTPEIDEAAHEHIKLKYQLQGAVDRGELLLYYQPQFKVTNGELVGLEALLRWNHPELGLISPNRFISLAEESGLIVPIGAWVLAEACRQNQLWQQAGYPALRVAINVSILQFMRVNFVETVVQALEQVGLDPKWLQLELTESLLMRNPQDTASKLSRLRALGVAIAIDDFGTGYSSLTYLRQLPIDTLKIAQPFVGEIGVNLHNTPGDEAIITAITNLAHSLGMRVVAEGVETEQQLEFLRRIGCDEMQGFLFSKPQPVHEIETLLQLTFEDVMTRYVIKESVPE